MNQAQTFRIVLVLPKPDAEALARLAEREMRQMREQALFLVRAGLVVAGELPKATTPQPSEEWGAEQ